MATTGRTAGVKELVKRYGLAVCCIVSPLFFTFVLELSTKRLVPPGIVNIVARYEPVKPTVDHQSAVQPATAPTSANIYKRGPDQTLYLQNQYIAGLYLLAIMNAFIYAAYTITFALPALVIVRRLGIGVLVAVVLVEALSALALAVPTWGKSAIYLPLPILRNLYHDIDNFDALKEIVPESGTFNVIWPFEVFDAFVGLLWATFVGTALAILSIRASKDELNIRDLKDRRNSIYFIIICSSAALIISIISSKMFLTWPLSLIEQSQAASIQLLMDAITTYSGALGTLWFLTALPPAIAAWRFDVMRFRSMRKSIDFGLKDVEKNGAKAEPPVDDGLNFAPFSIVTGLVAVIAPVITPVVADAVKHLLNLSQN